MRGVMAGGLCLVVGLLAAAVRADECTWRPAKAESAMVAPATTPAAAGAPTASLGRPTAVHAAAPVDPVAALGRPTAFQVHPPAGHYLPVSYSASPGGASSLVVRAKALDAPQPMPTGAPVKGPTITESPEEQYNKGVVTTPSPTGTSPGVTVTPGPDGLIVVPPGPVVGPQGPVISQAAPDCGDGSCGPACPGPACPGGEGCVECPPCDGCCMECPAPGHRWWVSGEYLLWWVKHPDAPPLVTTGPQASLGALGQPGTAVLFGGAFDLEEQNGGRFSAGIWLDPEERWGLEGTFFFLGQRSAHFLAASGGEPVLARPIISAFTGAEGVEQVANLQEVINGIGVLPLAGSIRIDAPSRLWGAELNGLFNLNRSDSSRWDVFAGFRYLDLREAINITESLTAQPVAPFPPGVPFPPPSPPGTTFVVVDSFTTRNNFYGGQVGVRNEWYWKRWQLDLTGQVALGDTHQMLDINGSTTITVPGVGTTTSVGGLLAQPTNIGHYHRDRFTVVPQVGLKIGYQLTDHLRAYVGYDFLYWSSVARPGNQIDRVVNPSQVPSLGGTPGTLVGPARPQFFAFSGTDYWAQGVDFGLEFRY